MLIHGVFLFTTRGKVMVSQSLGRGKFCEFVCGCVLFMHQKCINQFIDSFTHIDMNN
jgi:hypothetical protein